MVALTLSFSISRMKSPADSRMPRLSFLPASVSLICLYWGRSSRRLPGWLEKLLLHPDNRLRGIRDEWLTRRVTVGLRAGSLRKCHLRTPHKGTILALNYLNCLKVDGMIPPLERCSYMITLGYKAITFVV